MLLVCVVIACLTSCWQETAEEPGERSEGYYAYRLRAEAPDAQLVVWRVVGCDRRWMLSFDVCSSLCVSLSLSLSLSRFLPLRRIVCLRVCFTLYV